MGVQLLDKTRKINKLLHNNSSSKVVFNDICEVLTEILNSNVLVISKKESAWRKQMRRCALHYRIDRERNRKTCR